MANSKHIAGLVGPTLIAVVASELMNPHIWTTVTLPLIYQAGMLLFVAGLATVRTHNVWVRGWPIVITVLGWIAMALGLSRMFAPELAQKAAQAPQFVLGLQLALLAAGVFLTLKAIGRDGA